MSQDTLARKEVNEDDKAFHEEGTEAIKKTTATIPMSLWMRARRVIADDVEMTLGKLINEGLELRISQIEKEREAK